jgi:Family of unknown function (DUF5701)
VSGRFDTVVMRDRVPPRDAIAMVQLGGRPGFTTMEPDDLARFEPTDAVELPVAGAYALVDVDPGREFLGVTPDEALPAILERGRSPLTIEEAIAVIRQHPEILERDRFSILGSRCGDRRVPAIWVSQRRPRLGWCYAGAPHTWLGSASCAERIGQPALAASAARFSISSGDTSST